MKRIGIRHACAATVVLCAVLAGSAGTGIARVRASAGAVTRTFSLIDRPGSSTATIVNIDSLLINARCDSRGNPVIFAFTSADRADLFGRIFDGLGRLHIVKNSSFTKTSRGVGLTPSSGDFDSTGSVLFETSTGKVVTVSYALDNSTTLARQNVCTVYGSFIAS